MRQAMNCLYRHEQNVQVEEQRYRPAGVVERYGADTVRLFMMFASPAI